MGELELGDDMPDQSPIFVNRIVGGKGKISPGTAGTELELRYQRDAAYTAAVIFLYRGEILLTAGTNRESERAFEHQRGAAAQAQTGVEELQNGTSQLFWPTEWLNHRMSSCLIISGLNVI